VEELEEKVNSKPTSNIKKKGTTLNPSEISQDLAGDKIRVQGRLEFRKEASGHNFYKLSGAGGTVVVRSETRIPEGKKNSKRQGRKHQRQSMCNS